MVERAPGHAVNEVARAPAAKARLSPISSYTFTPSDDLSIDYPSLALPGRPFRRPHHRCQDAARRPRRGSM